VDTILNILGVRFLVVAAILDTILNILVCPKVAKSEALTTGICCYGKPLPWQLFNWILLLYISNNIVNEMFMLSNVGQYIFIAFVTHVAVKIFK